MSAFNRRLETSLLFGLPPMVAVYLLLLLIDIWMLFIFPGFSKILPLALMGYFCWAIIKDWHCRKYPLLRGFGTKYKKIKNGKIF